MHSPKAMAEGNITVGLIVDERASDKQVEAISAIATGAAGGPMAALGPLVGRVAGVEKRPISFEADGMKVTTLDVTDLDKKGADEARVIMKANGLEISSLGYYPNPLHPDPEHSEIVIGHFFGRRRRTVDADRLIC